MKNLFTVFYHICIGALGIILTVGSLVYVVFSFMLLCGLLMGLPVVGGAVIPFTWFYPGMLISLGLILFALYKTGEEMTTKSRF